MIILAEKSKRHRQKMEDEIFECPFKKRKIEETQDDQVNSIATDETISHSDENKPESSNGNRDDEVEPNEDSAEG